MNLQQLQYFEKIAETHNFTKAAEDMNVTQPALSKAISKLEEELGADLIERTGRNAALTQAGEVFLNYSKQGLKQIQRGVEEVRRFRQPNEGILSISATKCIGTNFLPFIISGFMTSHADIKIQFLNQKPEDIFEGIKQGEIDFGFFDENDKSFLNQEIESIPIQREEYVLIVPKGHWLSEREEISLTEIKEEPYIVFSREEGKISTKEGSFIAEYLNDSKKIMVHPDQMHMIGALVAANVGITIVPNTPMINESKVSIVKIKENIGYKTIYLGWRKGMENSPIFKSFYDYVKHHAQGEELI